MAKDLKDRVAASTNGQQRPAAPSSGGIQFVRATRSAVKARVALTGPSGAGKTYTGLLLACALGERVAAIDTERGRASMYAGLNGWEFDALNPQSFAPASLVDALGVASGAGYDAVLIDSLSHYWSGVDGMQEQADRRSERGNSFSGWKAARPDERRMFDAIAAYPGHVIVTLRSKTAYVIEEYTDSSGRKKSAPRKIGLKPDQREGIEFEFDLIGDMDQSNTLTVSKTRLPALAGQVIEQPGVELARTIWGWLSEGEAGSDAHTYREQALDSAATYEGLRALYSTVRDAGLVNAPVTDADGAPTVLGELIVTRGQVLAPPKDEPGGGQ